MLKELEKFIDDYYEKNKNSGVIRVTVKDEIVFEKNFGYADVEHKVPFSKDSKFTFYSLSKPFCTIGLLKLKDKGLIDLDVHPAVYVPEAKGFDKRVTIRHLLLHISGIPDFDISTDFRTKGISGTPDMLRKQLCELAEYPMYFEPDSNFKYTNINFILCALIIENVSGMKYKDYMQKEVFAPRGMKNTCIDEKGLVLKNRVTGYELLENGEIKPIDRATDWAFGAADCIGTLDDVYCLNKAIKHKLLLKEETWKEVLTPSRHSSFGMGCLVTKWHGMKLIRHNGGWYGFRTLHYQLPEDDFDIIILSNSGWGDLRNNFSEKIYEIFYGDNSNAGEIIQMDAGYATR